MNILIIEDEIKTARYIKTGLSENGFFVDTSDNGYEGLELVKSNNYDLIILDVMLPGKDGWTILKELRDKGKLMPVIFLTAKDTVLDKVKGLELGADDYLIKPFAFSELLARIRALLRRGKTIQPDKIEIADLTIDLLRQTAHRNGRFLNLTKKEFMLLSLFALHKGEVLSRTLIAEQIWNINFITDTNIIDVAVRRLRQKLDDPYDKKLIRTVRGVGYILEDR
ncbi:MAG TPA: response regulator [Ignavibacteria bacterium]|nr:response regulator [Ignavibacteria bacterium]